jgi:hypothetical protein
MRVCRAATWAFCASCSKACLDAAAVEIPDLRVRFDPERRDGIVTGAGVSPS